MSQSEIFKTLYPKRSKYNVGPPEERTADGIVFHSKHECDTYLKFKALVRCGTFAHMERQVKFPILVRDPHGQFVKVFDWIADFVITDLDDREHVYDAKGFATKEYKLKKKCVEAQYGIRILEV